MSSVISDLLIDQKFVDAVTWPIFLDSNVVVKFIQNVLLSGKNQYFVVNSKNVSFYGNNCSVTVSNIIDYPGLIKNNIVDKLYQKSINIEDLTIISIKSTLLNNSADGMGSGWVTHTKFSGNINYCFVSGDIPDNCGGIVGSHASDCKISNCVLLSNIAGDNAGGIAGRYSDCQIQYCYSTKAITGNNSGGIVGDGNKSIINGCYSLGSINGKNSGGIAGTKFEGNITNCYTVGNISGVYAGGIAGNYNSGTISNCYTTGIISGKYAEGITTNNNTSKITLCCATNKEWNDRALLFLITKDIWINLDDELNNVPFVLFTFNRYKYSNKNNVLPDNTLSYESGQISNLPADLSIHKIIKINDIDPLNFLFRIALHPAPTSNIIFFPNTSPMTYKILVMSKNKNSNKYNFAEFNLIVKKLSCFLEGTYILTPTGEKKVEQLKKGDKILTSNGKIVDIINIFYSKITENRDKLYPVEINKNHFAVDIPSRNTYISRHHKIFWDNTWITPVDHPKIFKHKIFDVVHYYHIETPKHLIDNIVANNMVCESWYDHLL